MITANDFVPRLRTKIHQIQEHLKRAPKEFRLPDDHTKGFRSETRKLEPN